LPLLVKGKITQEMITMLSTWRHSGFHVFCGNCILPKEDKAMENLARDIIRVFFQERMTHLDKEGKVGYTAAMDGKRSKPFISMNNCHFVFMYREQGLVDGVVIGIL
jgi:hypothetical protein